MLDGCFSLVAGGSGAIDDDKLAAEANCQRHCADQRDDAYPPFALKSRTENHSKWPKCQEGWDKLSHYVHRFFNTFLFLDFVRLTT